VTVLVYDGPRELARFDNLALRGDHRYNLDSANTFTISPPINAGNFRSVGITVVAVEFGKKDSIGMPYPGIWFTQAGADFWQ
jgi:hypothetical protein